MARFAGFAVTLPPPAEPGDTFGPDGGPIPRAWRRFGGFRIDSSWAWEATARVYLARDDELGGRLVVVKISPDRGPEPSFMGRLDHNCIMPVLSVTRDGATGLRVLCMPYRPGFPWMRLFAEWIPPASLTEREPCGKP